MFKKMMSGVLFQCQVLMGSVSDLVNQLLDPPMPEQIPTFADGPWISKRAESE